MFVADEIQTGFCRTGSWFACEHEGVEPDLVTMAKGMAGGLPLSGVVGRADLMDAVHAGGLGGTYGGNPIACAASLAAIETMRELDLAGGGPADRGAHGARRWALADRSRRSARSAAAARCWRSSWSSRVRPDRTGPVPDAARTAAVAQACHAAGLLVLTCGTYGNVLRFLPPLVISDGELDRGLAILSDALG